MKLLITLLATAVLGLIAFTIWVGARSAEGTVVANPYEAGLHHDAALHRAEALGWTLSVDEAGLRTDAGELRLSLAGRDGAPLEGADVQVRLSRAGTSRMDRTAAARSDGGGRYRAAVDLPEGGFWDLAVAVRRGDDRLVLERRVRVAAAGPACDLGQGPCGADADGARLTLELAPRPIQPLSDLAVTVTLARDGAPVEGAEVALDLAMPGMFMGQNRVALQPLGGGRYAGRAVVVRCASGRRDWVAEVVARLPGGVEARARFPFQAAD
jgi:nitrogen fixation protein FixH